MKIFAWLMLPIALISVLADPLYAEEIIEHTQRSKAYQKQRKVLLELKQSDPEAFAKRIEAHRERFKMRMADLQKTNPEKHKQVQEKRRGRNAALIHRLKKTNPEKYDKIMRRRQQSQANQNRLADTSSIKRKTPINGIQNLRRDASQREYINPERVEKIRLNNPQRLNSVNPRSERMQTRNKPLKKRLGEIRANRGTLGPNAIDNENLRRNKQRDPRNH
ncbi:MAG: hypothetical protein ACI9CF_001727 [Candidatus Omnitrophota bacterium]|jgi:hypothetical protein